MEKGKEIHSNKCEAFSMAVQLISEIMQFVI